ncbi:MAG: transpeptidase family protein, partial [Myxococcales bacterium]|nr:transpeptidase family protein [Myxococcales bacterium]
ARPQRNARPVDVTPVGDGTIRGRMLVVAVGLGALLLVATGRAIIFQTTDAAALQREAARNYVRTETLDDWRGDITDRDGALMAVTVHRWAVTVDPQQIEDPTATAQALSEVLGIPAPEVHERIDPATARPVQADDAPDMNPATTFARRQSTPMVRLMQRVWGTEREVLDRRLDVLEKFFQLEQLQDKAVFPIVRKVAEAAESAVTAIHADADSLRFFPSRGRRFAYVAHDLDDEAVRRLDAAKKDWNQRCREIREDGKTCSNPLAQIYTRPEARRYYPKRELATQLVGLIGRESTGLSGVERGMEGVLAGGQHQVTAIKDKNGSRIYLNGLPDDAPLEGPTVELTIDEQIQAVAEQELAKSCLSSGARAGYAVVMRITTGEVLAVANFPTFNPNTFQSWFNDRQPLKDERAALAQKRADMAWARSWDLNAQAFPGEDDAVANEAAAEVELELDAYTEYAHAFPNASRNTAFLDVYEPGSIMKVFTVAAALDTGVVALDETFDLENGDWELQDADDNVIHDISHLAEGTVATILKKSSNIGAAKIAFRLGSETLDKYLRAFGFGATTHSGVPGEAKGILRPAAEWVPVELANVSFGQGMAATGIQLVTAVSALANGGKLMKPMVVKRVVDGRGRTLVDYAPEVVRQVISEKTARTVLDLMQGVIDPDGTGRRAYIPEYPVAGKTGTGQKPHLRKRGYSETMWVNTFLGVAPADHPELAIVILVDEPTGKRHGGGLIAAPTFKAIMKFALEHLGVPSPYATATRQAWLDPDVLAQRRAAEPEDPAALDAAAPPIDDAAGGTVPVPDFRGLTMDAVRASAEGAGLQVRLFGTGVATAQDTPAHQRVDAGTVVTVTFESRAPGANEVPEAAQDAMPPLPGGEARP